MDQSNAKIIPFGPEARFITVATITNDTVSEKLNDALTPSYQAEFDPQEAESAGAFFEDALSEDDALASTHDFAHFAPQSPPPKS
jgi:hypothetical protein